MNMLTLSLIVKCLLALAFLICGFWLTLLFNGSEATNEFLKSYHTYLGIASCFLGILMAVGQANLTRMLTGFAILALGLFVFNYFMAFRSGLLGQLITNIGAPALCLLGIFTMIDFGSKIK